MAEKEKDVPTSIASSVSDENIERNKETKQMLRDWDSRREFLERVVHSTPGISQENRELTAAVKRDTSRFLTDTDKVDKLSKLESSDSDDPRKKMSFQNGNETKKR